MDTTGAAKILYLPNAVYQVKEVQAPAGFAPSKESATVTVRESNSLSNPAKIDVKNAPLFFELMKTDALTKEVLSGVPFKLTDKDGKDVLILKQNDGSYKPVSNDSAIFTTGADGKVIIKYLPIGAYTLSEQPFDGYIRPARAAGRPRQLTTDTSYEKRSRKWC